MTRLLTVALLQIESAGYDQAENLRRGEAACREAAALGADIALFPEMWNIGYSFEDDDLERWRAQAIPRDGEFVTHFARVAAELRLAIAVTYLEAAEPSSAASRPTPSTTAEAEGRPTIEAPSGPRNTVTLIDRHGRDALTYAKVHACAFDQPEGSLTPGESFPVATLDTAAGPVEVGAMICYDREFPETARILALNGAELLLVPNACPMEDNRTGQLRARAFENEVGVALANYPVTHDDCDGHSVAFDPIVYGPDGDSRDTLLVRAGGEEGIVLARFDVDALREWRRTEVWGPRFRRPSLYGRLTEPDGD